MDRISRSFSIPGTVNTKWWRVRRLILSNDRKCLALLILERCGRGGMQGQRNFYNLLFCFLTMNRFVRLEFLVYINRQYD